jgi:hypothetical protein
VIGAIALTVVFVSKKKNSWTNQLFKITLNINS